MGVRYLKSHIHKCMGYTGAKVNLSREARSTDDWFMMNSRPRGLVFDGDGYCYWTTDAPWCVANRVDYLYGGQSLPEFQIFLVYFERFLSEGIPICVVFDGVKPSHKSITLSKRREMEVSFADKVLNQGTMLNGSRELFTRKVMIEALYQLQQKYSRRNVIIHNALGEADSEVVRVARELNAYAIVGNDYDFVVLLSNAPDIAYIPIDNIAFRGTEQRSYPSWEYQRSDNKDWDEFSKEECLRLDSAFKSNRDFFVPVSIGNVVRGDADKRFGYSQFKLRVSGSGEFVAVRQPNILVLKFDVRDIFLGLGLEETSIPAFATLVGCDFLPYHLLRDFHKNIGILKRQGDVQDIIPSVAALVRQHGEWSQLLTTSPFPFNEHFFARFSNGHEEMANELSPKEMSTMARASVEFFSLQRDREELLLGAVLLLTGLFDSFSRGLLEARVVKYLVRSSDTISMPPPMELSTSIYNSRVNENLYPLMGILMKLMKTIANGSKSSCKYDDLEDAACFSICYKNLIAVLDHHEIESILDLTRCRSEQRENFQAAIVEISDHMYQFFSSLSLPSRFATPFPMILKESELDQQASFDHRKYKLLLDILSSPLEGGCETAKSNSYKVKTKNAVHFYNTAWSHAHKDHLLDEFYSIVLAKMNSGAEFFFECLSLLSVLFCGYTVIWGGVEDTATLIKAYLISIILKDGRSYKSGSRYDSEHVKALCLQVNVADRDDINRCFRRDSASSRVQSMITALTSSHLLINQLCELSRVQQDDPSFGLQPSFVDLIDGRLIHFVHDVLTRNPQIGIKDFFCDSSSLQRFDELSNFFTVRVRTTLNKVEWNYENFVGDDGVNIFDHSCSDSDSSSDSDEDADDDKTFENLYSMMKNNMHDATNVGNPLPVLPPPLRQVDNYLEEARKRRNSMQDKFSSVGDMRKSMRKYVDMGSIENSRTEYQQEKYLMRLEKKICEMRGKGDDWANQRLYQKGDAWIYEKLKAEHDDWASLRLRMKRDVRIGVINLQQRYDITDFENVGKAFKCATDAIDFEPRDFQRKAFNHINRGKSVLALAPTGSGKTFIALRALYHALCLSGKRAALICPTKALVNQSYETIWSHFDLHDCPDSLGVHSFSDISHNVDDAQVLVTVAQSFLNMLLAGNSFDVVVLDEFHSILGEKDGYVWESIVNILPQSTQIICLSATLPECSSVLSWLQLRHPSVELVEEYERDAKQEIFVFARGSLSRLPQECLSIYANDTRGKKSSFGLDLSREASHWEKRALTQVADAKRFDTAISNLYSAELSFHPKVIVDQSYEEEISYSVPLKDLSDMVLNVPDEDNLEKSVVDLIDATDFLKAARVLASYCNSKATHNQLTETDYEICLTTIQSLIALRGGLLRKYDAVCPIDNIDINLHTRSCVAQLLLYSKLDECVLLGIKQRSPSETLFTQSWITHQMCKVLIDLSLRCGYFYLKSSSGDACLLSLIESIAEVTGATKTSRKMKRLCELAAIEVKEYWMLEFLRPTIAIVKTGKKSKTNLKGVITLTDRTETICTPASHQQYECFVGMMSYLFAAKMLPYDEIRGLDDIVTKYILKSETLSFQSYNKLYAIPGVLKEVDAELNAFQKLCLDSNTDWLKLCTMLTLRLVRSTNSAWVICKRILPTHVIRPHGVTAAQYLAHMFRTIKQLDEMEYTKVHGALLNMLEISSVGKIESDAISEVLHDPTNADIVDYLRGSFAAGSMPAAFLTKLLLKDSDIVDREELRKKFNFMLQQWNICHEPLLNLLSDFLVAHSVTPLEVLDILEDICSSMGNCETDEHLDDNMVMNLTRIQLHEAISVSFFLLEACHVHFASLPPLPFEIQSEIVEKGKQVHELMVRMQFEEYIRLKLILTFDLSQNPKRSRVKYRLTFLPHFVESVNVSLNEKSSSNAQHSDEETESLQLQISQQDTVPDNWFDDIDSDDEDGDLPLPVMQREVSSESEIGNVGHDNIGRDSRMYLRWASDMVLRQAQRACYEGSLKDENCFQLLNFLKHHHPHTECESATPKNMLPALLFTFEKVVATELATKMVDIYDVDMLRVGSTEKDRTEEEKAKVAIMQEISIDIANNSDVPAFLQRLLVRGIGVHHSDISGTCRSLVERLFHRNLVKVVFNTSTLAEGIHMPCQTVVFLQDKHNLVDNKLFRQCAGRAGRQGNSDVGFVIVTGNYSVIRLQNLLKGLDDKVHDGEYGRVDEIGEAKSSLIPAVRFQLEGICREDRSLPFCFSGGRHINNSYGKVTYFMQCIKEMIGETTTELCKASIDIDIRLRPLFAYIARVFISNVRKKFSKPNYDVWVREVVNLVLWFREPVQSKAYSCNVKSRHENSYDHRPVPLLDSMPTYLTSLVQEWNQNIYQSILLAEEGNLLESAENYKKGPDLCVIRDEHGAVKKSFGTIITSNQLLLEKSRLSERVAPEIDGLSGHAYGFVASGINQNNMNSVFPIPNGHLPLLDPNDISIKSKQGFLLQLIFSKKRVSDFNGPEMSLLVDRIRIKYGLRQKSLEKELLGIRRALTCLCSFVESQIPVTGPSTDPAIEVLGKAVDRLHSVQKLVWKLRDD